MNSEQNFDTLEIADLEQDIGGVSSVEPAEARGVNDFIVTMYIPPV